MKIGTQRSLKNSNDLNIFTHDHRLKGVTNYKYLGVYVDSTLAWKEHLSYMRKRTYPKIRVLNRLSSFLSRSVLLKICKQTMLPIFEYAAAKDWNDLPKSIRSITTFSSFKAALYSFLLKSDKLSHRCMVN